MFFEWSLGQSAFLQHQLFDNSLNHAEAYSFFAEKMFEKNKTER